jgi:hypothetical protein
MEGLKMNDMITIKYRRRLIGKPKQYWICEATFLNLQEGLNHICRWNGFGGPWIYELLGTRKADHINNYIAPYPEIKVIGSGTC